MRESAARDAFAKAYDAQIHGDFFGSQRRAETALRWLSSGDWDWKFRLLEAENYIHLGDPRRAVEILEKGKPPSRADLCSLWKFERAWAMQSAHPRDALRLFQDALQGALAGGDAVLADAARVHIGELLAGDARFDEAETCYRAVLQDAEQRHDDFWIAGTDIGLGFSRAKQSRFDAAIPYFERAGAIAKAKNYQSIQVMAEGNLGWCQVSLGNLDQAMQRYQSAESLSARIGMKDWEHRCLGAIGNIFMNRQALDDALRYDLRALEMTRQVGNKPWTAVALNNLALVYMKKGDTEAAQKYTAEAMRLDRELNEQWSLLYTELNAAGIDAQQGHYEQAEAGLQGVIAQAPRDRWADILWAAYSDLAELYRAWRRPQLADTQFRNAVATIDRVWSTLSAQDFKTTFLAPSHLIGVFQNYVSFLMDTGQAARALELAESSRARVLSEGLESGRTLPPNLRLDRLVAAARASRTVMLSYWLAPAGSAVWVVGPAGLAYKRLPAAGQIAALVRSYSRMITAGQDPLAGGDVTRAIYNTLLEPVRALIPRGAQVIIVPDGELHQLNFETLVVPNPQPHYWIEDVTIAVAPSLRVLQPEGGAPPARKLLLFGDPVLQGPEFPRLEGVREEIAAVEKAFPENSRRTVTGAAAVPAAYRAADPKNFTYIHFATHAEANRESPLNSAIILSHAGDDFKLYARDVAPLPLRAQLVTISACRSAGPKAYSGEGLMGFAWAFLHAQAQNVIATLWDEDDAISVDLMAGLYRGIAEGQSPARALRASKLALLHGGGRGRRPYYWGAMEVFTRQIPAPPRGYGPSR